MNNRDHRKILVIDGHTCFSGGFNLADEYINKLERFGHWKDNAILIKGEAVANFTNMFLATSVAAQAFDENKLLHVVKKVELAKAKGLAPKVYIDEAGGFPENDGYVQPYGDLPFDGEAVGERVYIDLINAAHDHLYMVTPYLIIDKEMENAMIHAAWRGVDIRLLTPHIPDKKALFNLTRSYYGNLIRAGVRVYEYTPGFVHEKTFICDGRMATVGTINLDYRSLYLHLECGTFMVGCSCIKDMEKDFLETLEKSEEITYAHWRHWRDRQYWYWAVLNILGPFL
jgi:cardiolipin synthase